LETGTAQAVPTNEKDGEEMNKQYFLVALLLAASATAAFAADTINAAGATFPAPIYQKWFEEYHKAHGDVQVNYQAIGSGGGVRQLSEGTVDFGASDFFMTDDQLAKVTRYKVLHFPTVIGGIVPTYNVPGIPNINFSGPALADIYLGRIKKWNDPALAKDNPGVKLPNEDITVVHRSDGSGTSFIFADYLSKVSPEWKSKVGVNASVNWPVGLGGKGNEGVAGLVKQTPFSIGYVELTYAAQNKMEYGSMKNADGNFVKADVMTVTAAAAGAAKAKDMPADFRVSITNAPGKNAYPIASFTWMLIPDKIADANKKKAVTAFLQWMLTMGQADAPGLYYAPLPKEVVAKELKQIALIK
jgi:phosphate transport system substrate-binding protein